VSDSKRSQRPVWLGSDKRGWDHARLHLQMLEDNRLGAIEMAVYFGLAAHAEANSGEAYPAAETLAQYCQLGERRVRDAIKALTAYGYITTQRVAGKASRYYLQPMPEVPEEHLPSHPRWARRHAPRPSRTPASGADVQLELLSTNNQRSPAPDAGQSGTTNRTSPAPRADELEPPEPEPPNNVPPTAGADAPPTAQSILREYIDACRQRPPGQYVNHLGRVVKGLLDEGFDEADVRKAMAKMRSKGMHPSTLPSLVNDVINGQAEQRYGGVPEHLIGGRGKLVG
jgi:Helix-turn-helix domain